MSDERIFWVSLVFAMIISRVAIDGGLLHHFWPKRFDPPTVCKKVAVGDFGSNLAYLPAMPTKAAIQTVAQGVAHG